MRTPTKVNEVEEVAEFLEVPNCEQNPSDSMVARQVGGGNRALSDNPQY